MQCWVVATQLPRLVDRMHSQVGRGRAELEGESRTRAAEPEGESRAIEGAREKVDLPPQRATSLFFGFAGNFKGAPEPGPGQSRFRGWRA